MSTRRYKALIWDFGGVVTSSPFEAFAEYEAANGLPPAFIRSVNARNPDNNAWALFEQARIDAPTFDRLFGEESAALGHKVAGCTVLALLSGQLRPRVVEALRTLRAEYALGCITNNMPVPLTSSHKVTSAMGEVMALFHHVLESAKLGIRKPDPRIYEMMCKALNVAPQDCIFMDDLGINLKPARALGMTTIKVTSEDQCLTDLYALLR
ncbi:MAG: hypothetical protein RLZZ157_1226 [Pseudomonadota bacterium]|jgi:putative hydrolase of the HAD superfamily